MTGILILFVIALWGALLFCAGYLAAYPFRKGWIRALVGAAVTAAFFTLPVRDELKGSEEFEALCRTGGVYQISPRAEGKKFDLRYHSSPNRKLSGYTRPVEESIISYTDEASGEVIVTARAYFAGGGWLVQKRIISLTSTDGPLIGRSQCFPTASERIRLREVTNKIVN